MKHTRIVASKGKRTRLQRAESLLEAVLFGSRWLMAPFYLLMVAALGMLLVKFAQETWHIITQDRKSTRLNSSH